MDDEVGSGDGVRVFFVGVEFDGFVFGGDAEGTCHGEVVGDGVAGGVFRVPWWAHGVEVGEPLWKSAPSGAVAEETFDAAPVEPGDEVGLGAVGDKGDAVVFVGKGLAEFV